MCNLCCLAPSKFCWSCQAPQSSNLKPCKYCYAEPRERYAEPRERYAEPRERYAESRERYAESRERYAEPCNFVISKNNNKAPPPPI